MLSISTVSNSAMGVSWPVREMFQVIFCKCETAPGSPNLKAIPSLKWWEVLPCALQKSTSSKEKTTPSMGRLFFCAVSFKANSFSSTSLADSCPERDVVNSRSKPKSFRKSRRFCLDFISSRPLSTLNGKKRTPRLLQTAESSCLTVPDAKFRGVEYLSSSFSICSLISPKVVISIKASPVISKRSVYLIFLGTLTKVLALWVITSPTLPSPLVAAAVSSPFS